MTARSNQQKIGETALQTEKEILVNNSNSHSKKNILNRNHESVIVIVSPTLKSVRCQSEIGNPEPFEDKYH